MRPGTVTDPVTLLTNLITRDVMTSHTARQQMKETLKLGCQAEKNDSDCL